MREFKKGYIGYRLAPEAIVDHEAIKTGIKLLDSRLQIAGPAHVTFNLYRNIRKNEMDGLIGGIRDGLNLLRDEPLQFSGFGLSRNSTGSLLYQRVTPPSSLEAFNQLVRASLQKDQDRITNSEPLHLSMIYAKDPKQEAILRLSECLLNRIYQEMSWEFNVDHIGIRLGKKVLNVF